MKRLTVYYADADFHFDVPKGGLVEDIDGDVSVLDESGRYVAVCHNTRAWKIRKVQS